MKRQPTEWEKIFANSASVKGYIYMKKANNPFENGQKT